MSQISVFVKGEQLFFACRAERTEDGCVWHCANCNEVCCRVSFGIMNGFWRCRCGCELEINADGSVVDLRQYDTDTDQHQREISAVREWQNLNRSPELPTQPISNDEEFLKQCGIEIADTDSTP